MKPATTSKTKTSKQSPEITEAIEAAETFETPVPEAFQRTASIATAAYFKAEGRGFAPGGELDDWLAAEMEFESDSRKPGRR